MMAITAFLSRQLPQKKSAVMAPAAASDNALVNFVFCVAELSITAFSRAELPHD